MACMVIMRSPPVNLYIGVRGGRGRGFLGEECDGCFGVDEGSLI
jgi:hypothetical protein